MELPAHPAGLIDMRLLPALVLLLLAACRDGSPDHDNGASPGPNGNQLLPLPDRSATTVRRAAPSRAEIDRSPAVPLAFRGRWTGTRDDCADKAAALELDVAPRQLVFHESVGSVTAVEPLGEGKLALKANFTGEGSSWPAQLRLTLSAEGQRLTITDDRGAVIRKRCNAA